MNNTTHDSKDWQISQAALQSPPVAIDPLSSPKPTSFTAPNTYPHGYSSNEQQQSSYNQESDASRLPGLVAHSQPGTPRPDRPEYYPARTSVSARGRASLFANESGPFFNATEPFDNLYSSDKTTMLTVRVQSKMDRGFFMAENDWTCYRRNYFQVSSVFSLHGFHQYYTNQSMPIFVQMDHGFAPVQRFLLGISARVANSEKEIELIQHTPKRDKGPQFKPEPKAITPGGNLTMSSVANNQNIVTFERIQFKTATANNGKRRAAQQYYVCVVDLYAETERQELIKVASCRSSPLVVRGRSPGHYADVNERQTAPAQENIENQRQHVFSTYQKPSHTEYPNQGYPYYAPGYAYGNQQQNSQQNSNVSSPGSHPPLPSPYAHPTQVPNYAIHDASQPESYSNEFQNNTEETKILHHPFNMQQTGQIESPHTGYDWQRARYNSSSSSSSAPSPRQTNNEGPYFSHDARSSYSPSTPTYSGRKYPINKQIV